MPKRYVSLAFTTHSDGDRRYRSDHTDRYVYNGGFYIPPHLEGTWDIAKTVQVATQAGAHPAYFTNADGEKEVIINFGANPCPLSSTLSPRKIRFYFSTGNSTSIPIGETGTDIKVAYDGLKPLLETGDVKVICAHLIGEEWANLNDIAGVNFNPSESSAPGGNGKYFSGIMIEYVSEITDSSFPVSVKILSTQGNPAGSRLPVVFQTGEIENCILPVQANANFNCPTSKGAISHRRIIVNYKTDAIAIASEQRELPVKRTGAPLKTCLQAVGARPGVFCVGYKGETRKNIHSIA